MKTLITNRRTVLAGTLGAAAAGLALPRMAFAQSAGERRVLFVLLRGAADGMAMLAPTGDPGFAALRPGAAADYEGASAASSFFSIHPALAEVSAAYAAGDALFVHAAATIYRERSHFDGQNMLETGAATPYARTDGWLNRLVGLMAERHGGAPPGALAIAPTVPLALRGSQPSTSYAPSALPDASEDFIARVGMLYQADPQLGGLWSQALETQAMAAGDGLRNLRNAAAAGELAASLMRDAAGARIAMMELDGWDTHANQRGSFARQARALDALLGAYRTGMGPEWSNALVVVATEFGRTARFNGTNGTDHGTASAALLMGGALRGGRVIADWPGLGAGDLYEGRDLAPTIALESVLSGTIAEHMRLDPEEAALRLFPGRSITPLIGSQRG